MSGVAQNSFYEYAAGDIKHLTGDGLGTNCRRMMHLSSARETPNLYAGFEPVAVLAIVAISLASGQIMGK